AIRRFLPRKRFSHWSFLGERPYAGLRMEVNPRKVGCRSDRWSLQAQSPDTPSNVRWPKVCSQVERGIALRPMGEADEVVARDAARRAREEMHSVTESLRALLEDLRGGEEDEAPDAPRVVRTRGSAPSQ